MLNWKNLEHENALLTNRKRFILETNEDIVLLLTIHYLYMLHGILFFHACFDFSINAFLELIIIVFIVWTALSYATGSLNI